MKKECPICLEEKRIKRFIFCNTCCNLFCSDCSTTIKGRNNKCPFCRSDLIDDTKLYLRKSYSIITQSATKYGEKKELTASAYCFVLFMQTEVYKSFDQNDIKALIENAKRDLGADLPEYIFKIAKKLSTKRKQKKASDDEAISVIKKMNEQGKYYLSCVLLYRLIMEENKEALEILEKMIRIGLVQTDMKASLFVSQIREELNKKYGNKYDYVFIHNHGTWV